MGKYYHDQVVYNGIDDEGRSAAGTKVRSAEAARKRMLNRDVRHKQRVERDRAAREWEKVQAEQEKELERLDRWAKGTGFYKDYADYLERKKSGRQGYAD